MKTKRNADEIEAAMIAEGHTGVEAAAVRIRLSTRKPRDGCPVVYDIPSSGVDNIVARYDRVKRRSFTNVRALITTEEAREIARRVMDKRFHPVAVAMAMAEFDRDLDEYQYGPTDE